jgi:hypothetical protein
MIRDAAMTIRSRSTTPGSCAERRSRVSAIASRSALVSPSRSAVPANSALPEWPTCPLPFAATCSLSRSPSRCTVWVILLGSRYECQELAFSLSRRTFPRPGQSGARVLDARSRPTEAEPEWILNLTALTACELTLALRRIADPWPEAPPQTVERPRLVIRLCGSGERRAWKRTSMSSAPRPDKRGGASRVRESCVADDRDRRQCAEATIGRIECWSSSPKVVPVLHGLPDSATRRGGRGGRERGGIWEAS